MRLTPLGVRESVEKRRPRFLAWIDDAAVGWCDIIEKPQEARDKDFSHMRVSGEYFDSYLMAWLC